MYIVQTSDEDETWIFHDNTDILGSVEKSPDGVVKAKGLVIEDGRQSIGRMISPRLVTIV